MNPVYTIVEIKPLKGRGKLRRVILDSGEYFDADEELCYIHSLRVDEEISLDRLKELRFAAGKKLAKDSALNLLAVRQRSENEIKRRLRMKQVEGAVLDTVVHDLKKYGLVDDEKFALSFASGLINRKKAGRKLVRMELRNKGIGRTVTERVIEKLFAEKNEADTAYEAFTKKIRPGESLDDLKTKKRLADFLARRGYSWDIISEVFNRYNESENYR